MTPDLTAAFIDNRTRPRGIRRPRRHERGIVVVRDETDLLAVRLVGDWEPTRPGVIAHGILGAIPNGKASLCELILRQREEKIGLILRAVDAALQQVASRG